MKIKVFSTAILASLLCLSCNETNLESIQTANTQAEPKAEYTYDVDIEATAEAPKDTTQGTRIADMPFRVTKENLNDASTLVPKMNLTGNTVSSVIVLYDKTNNKKMVLEENWNIKVPGENPILKLLTLKTYTPLATGDWYLMAFVGGGKKSGNNLQVTTNTTLEPMKEGNSFTASCPFATTWRKIIVKGNKIKLQDAKNQMKFKPQGVFLVLKVENRMTLDVKLNRDVRMESNAFCSSGTYDFNINQNTMADNADLAFDYWSPDASKAITTNSSTYEKYNAKHYFTNLKLNYNASVNDGSNRSGQSDLGSYLYFNKKNKGANPQTASSYVLCVMPVNYKKTSAYSGAEPQVLFYGKVSTIDPTRTQYTYDATIYFNDQNPNPKTWRPYMEGRYLLGSTAKTLDKGKSYNMTLRIIRPMLPIERLYAAKQGMVMEQLGRGVAENIAEGVTPNGNYKNLQHKYYRFPKYSEFVPIFTNPKKELDNGKGLGGVSPFNAGDEYGNSIKMRSKLLYADINGQQNKFDNWFCTVPHENVLYGIMYWRPTDNLDAKATDNYKVAVRITFPELPTNDYAPENIKGIAIIDVYYLGPNYNLSYKTAGYHCCSESFWNKLETEHDYINRWFQLGAYWLNDKETHQSTEPKRLFDYFYTTGSAITQQAYNNLSVPSKCWFLPWLKEPAW